MSTEHGERGSSQKQWINVRVATWMDLKTMLSEKRKKYSDI